MREAGARADTEPRYADARDAAAAEIAPLEAKVAKLVVTFSGPPPAGARVTVNGVVLPAARLGTAMALLPGTVEIACEGLGRDVVKRTEKLGAGETKTIVLSSPAPAKTASPGPTAHASGAPSGTAAPSPSGASSSDVPKVGGTVRLAGYGVAGVGVVGMVLFGVGTSLADAKLAQLEKECGGVRCTDPKYAGVVDSGKSMDLLSTVGLGVGIAGLVGGAAMIVFGGPRPVSGSPAGRRPPRHRSSSARTAR